MSTKTLFAKKKKKQKKHAQGRKAKRHETPVMAMPGQNLTPEAPDAGMQDPRYQEAHGTCGHDSRYAEAPDAGHGRGHAFMEGEFTQGRSQS